MAALESINIVILLGAVLVLTGILSSLVALRFGAPLLLIFLAVGVLAGESGPGGISFNNVALTYTVGSVALALILFDGGLRTRFATFRSVLAPAGTLATLGVLLTAAVTAPVAHYLLNLGWAESLLVGAVVASTDAAAVFFLMHSRGLRLRPRVGATIEVESGTNDPFAIFLAIVLVEIILHGSQAPGDLAVLLAKQGVIGAIMGIAGGYAITAVLNRLTLPQGLHAPFAATGAVVTFGIAAVVDGSGLLAVYLAGLMVGNRVKRAHSTIVAFLDAATWLGQIVMFVLLGLLAWPASLPDRLLPALAIAATLILVARSVFSWPRFRCLSACRTASSISMSVSWWSWFRCWCRAGASLTWRAGCGSPSAVPIHSSRASNSICPVSALRNWSAIASRREVRICAVASCRPGQS